MYKAVIVLALAAVAQAGVLDYHVGATQEQTIRGYGGLSSISHQAKNVNSAYSTASVYKTKVTNSALPVAYAATPAIAPVAHYAATPAIAPVAHYAATPAIAPVAHYAATPAIAPVARALPVAHAVAPRAGLLGVQYSPVTAGVASLNFDGFGVHYGY